VKAYYTEEKIKLTGEIWESKFFHNTFQDEMRPYATLKIQFIIKGLPSYKKKLKRKFCNPNFCLDTSVYAKKQYKTCQTEI